MRTSVTVIGRLAEEIAAKMMINDPAIGGFEKTAFFETKKDAERAIEFARFLDVENPIFDIKKIYQKDINKSDLLQQIYE